MLHNVKGTCAPVSFLVMGPIENNVYVIDDGEGCIVVDPTQRARQIVEALDGRALDAIFITHGHWDHTGAAAALRDITGAPVFASEVETPYINGEKSFGGHMRRSESCPVDRMVNDGDTVEVGGLTWRVIATPGHTPGGVCFYLEPSDGRVGAPVLVSGDTLFAGTHGRVDFAEGDPAAMRASLARLASLPDETVVLPGHNAITTIGRERRWLQGMTGALS